VKSGRFWRTHTSDWEQGRRVPEGEVQRYAGLAERAVLPILTAALQAGCSWLVSFNTRHFQPGHPDLIVLAPVDFMLRVRDLLARMV